jgi:nitrile hydratase
MASSDMAPGEGASSRRKFLRVSGLSGTGAAALLGTAGEADAGEAICPPADESRAELGGAPVSDAQATLWPLKARVNAMKQLLYDKGVVTEQMLNNFVGYYTDVVTPRLGAAVIAHAWKNPQFAAALTNPPVDEPFAATRLVRDFLVSRQPDFPASTAGWTIGPEGEWLRVVQNGPSGAGFVHNLVACTLCSCYPQALLGVQPVWYKSRQYRSRAVCAPRGIIREFAADRPTGRFADYGVGNYQAYVESYLGKVSEVRVWDSNSEARFLVIPSRPAYVTDAWTEQQMADLITRDSMIGTDVL